MPGFINLKLSGAYLRDYLREMQTAPHFGLEPEVAPRKVVMDYGGPNVAKPLHVGHLRSAIIGESLKRIYRYFGNDVTGDIHMGDWGLQMGLIIAELRCRQPELPYFDESFTGDYPAEAPFTISELEEIYPTSLGQEQAGCGLCRRSPCGDGEAAAGRPGLPGSVGAHNARVCGGPQEELWEPQCQL